MGPDAGPDQQQEAAQGDSGIQRDWDICASRARTNIESGCSSLAAAATQYLYVQISAADAATGAAQDVTGLAVSLALTTGANPGTYDWSDAQWLSRSVDGTTWARLLVEAGTLTAGSYFVFVQIAPDDELIILQAGTISVF
jgi:hypothetical protein